MPYQIQRSNGANLVEIADRSIDTTTTDLYLVGRGAVNYGQPFTENFVRLLENFANLTPPIKPLGGQLWYDTSTRLLKVFNGAEWKSVADQGIGIKPAEVRDLLKMADGAGSGIDADLLDGHHAGDFLLLEDVPVGFDWSLSGYAKLAGATFTGDVALNDPASANMLTVGGNQNHSAILTLSAAAEQERYLALSTGGVSRWLLRCDGAAETGDNTGSNFRLSSRDDTGASLTSAVLFAERATGDIGMGTASPSANLHVARPGQASFKVQNTATGVSTLIEATDAQVRLGSYTGHPVTLIQNNAAALTLDASTATIKRDTVVEGGLDVSGTLDAAAANFTSTVRIAPPEGQSAALLLGNDNPNDSYIFLSAAAGRSRYLGFRTAGVRRWTINCGTSAETGDDAGSDLLITPYDDSGVGKLALLKLTRNEEIVLGNANATTTVVGTFRVGDMTGDDLTATSMTAWRMRINGTGDVSATSTTHAFQVGADTGANIGIDQNEIQARNNGVVSTLYLNYDGGNVTLGNANATVTAARFRLTGTGNVTANSTTHAFQVGPDSRANMCIDQNEIQARSNGAVSTFTLNPDGGDVRIGNANATVVVPGLLSVAQDITNGKGEYLAFDNAAAAVSLWVNDTERFKVMPGAATFNGHTVFHAGNLADGVNPAIASFLDSTEHVYVSSPTTIVNSGQYVFDHGLGRVPGHVAVHLVCITAEAGYQVGDVIEVAPGADPDGNVEGISIVKTTAQVIVRIARNGPTEYVYRSSGDGTTLVAARWKMVIRAYKY